MKLESLAVINSGPLWAVGSIWTLLHVKQKAMGGGAQGRDRSAAHSW